jgi:hypothetical protein
MAKRSAKLRQSITALAAIVASLTATNLVHTAELTVLSPQAMKPALRVRFETLRRGVQEQRCSLFRDFKVPLFQTFCRSGRLILTGLSGFRNGL